jgi:beta-N-acetylhexosaminidase
MSDDVSMNALAGSVSDRTQAILAAGCDVVLHCNGNIEEMREVAAQTPELSGLPLERANRALAARRAPVAFDRAAARAELDVLVARANMASA